MTTTSTSDHEPPVTETRAAARVPGTSTDPSGTIEHSCADPHRAYVSTVLDWPRNPKMTPREATCLLGAGLPATLPSEGRHS